MNLGEKLRKLREQQGLSIGALASGIGLTKSLISQVERNLASPSIATIEKIAAYLNVPVKDLFDDQDQAPEIVRSDGRKKLIMPYSSIQYELLTPDLNRRVELLRAVIKPGQVGSPVPSTHGGEETVFVIEGSMEVEIRGEIYRLNKGDAISFDASQPHRFMNHSDEVAVIINAISPPTF